MVSCPNHLSWASFVCMLNTKVNIFTNINEIHVPKVGCICKVFFHRLCSQANFLSLKCSTKNSCTELATCIHTMALLVRNLSGELVFILEVWSVCQQVSIHIYREQRILMYFGLIEGMHQHLLSDCSLKAETPPSPLSSIYKIFTREEESR